MKKNDIETRRAVMRLTKTDKVRLLSPESEHQRLKPAITDFARSRRIGVAFTSEPDALIITKTATLATTVKYGEVDLLEVGQSHFFDLPVSEHQNVRSSMTYRGRSMAKAFRCKAENGGLRVTRVPMTDEERATCPPIDVGTRQTKYALERLETVTHLLFSVPRIEHDKIRLAAVRASIKHGWPISCKAQKDGSLLVFRPDLMPTEKRSGEATTEAGPVRKHDAWGLEALGTKREVRVNAPRQDHARLRLAAHRLAVKQAWTIRCRLQDDGTMLVYRTDQGAPSAGAAAHVSDH